MSQAARKATLTFSIFIITLLLIQTVHAPSLVLTITANENYNVGENIVISGTLTLDGSPVPDGLVSIQINDPRGNDPEHNLFIMRVLPTGTTPPGPWPVDILEMFPCDIDGNPKSNFRRGGAFGTKVTVRNNCASPQHIIVVLTLYYSNGIPFATVMMMNQWLDPLTTESKRRWLEAFIPSNAPLGTAYVYAGALSNWTQYAGVAWCPEKAASFNIVAASAGLSALTNTNQENYAAATLGVFDTTFKISDHGGILGNYNIYATSLYEMMPASDHKTFKAILITDVTPPPGVGDGKVDMQDIVYLILHFGSHDPIGDINKDGTVDMQDIVRVILDYGKWGVVP